MELVPAASHFTASDALWLICSVGCISRTSGTTSGLPERVNHRRKVSRRCLRELLGIDEQLPESNNVAIERWKVTTRAREFGEFGMPHAADTNECQSDHERRVDRELSKVACVQRHELYCYPARLMMEFAAA